VTRAGRTRLDTLLVTRGLVESRARARALILAGKVVVSGHPAAKAGSLVADDAAITITTPEHPWVSRGGVKLAHALDVFGIDVRGRLAVDIGASTGGFTDVLLQRGCARVMTIDVGHGQLHWKLRGDSRVVVREGLNARHLAASDLPGLGAGADIVVIDVSFISLRHILPVLPAIVAPGGDIVALVKPQFEAGREAVGPGGIVSDPAVHGQVTAAVAEAAAKVGLAPAGMTESPITGAEGNREFFLHLRPIQPAGEP
jgi:23S rRNA (cytidine1920-2'-O)/16S rRNA (cytidine1409-2'-O)-methyltransferase